MINQKLKHIQNMDNKCHIPDLVQSIYTNDNRLDTLIMTLLIYWVPMKTQHFCFLKKSYNFYFIYIRTL